MSYSYFQHQKIFSDVKWCIANNPNSISSEDRQSELKLRNTVLRLQEELSIAKEYRITEGEFDFLINIIQRYQNDLVQKYFKGFALHYRDLSEEEYYIFTLNDFLASFECEKDFFGNKMYDTKEYRSYGSWGLPSFEARYGLTDFAVTYHKLYYITQHKCIKLHAKPLTKNSIAILNLEATKKAIDTRETEVSRI